MIFPVKRNWKLTAPWEEKRPLNAPEKTHVHGAIDIGVPVGTNIIAPEDGWVWYHFQIRKQDKGYQNLQWIEDGVPYAFRNYFYDVFGGLICMEGDVTALTHVFAHIYINQLFNKPWICKEDYVFDEVETDNIFSFNFHTKSHLRKVLAGDKIGESGNAGFSMGPHIHYEIHNGREWTKHENRPDPADLYPEVKEHESEYYWHNAG